MLLRGKKALITGSSSGIGLGAAQAFCQHGATVVLTSERPLSACPDVQDLIASDNVCYLQADITQPGEASRVVAEAAAKLGGLDVLVNNVGTFREPPFLELTKAHFDTLFNLNVWVAIATTQAFVKQTAGRGGRIIFTTSLNGARSEPAHTLYDASKGAINALTRQLALELAPHNITAVAIAPGLVETPLTDMGLRSDPAARQAILDQIPVRRIATVADLSQWYAFLASDAASYATGTIINVDGGLDAQQMPTRPITEHERRGPAV